MNTGNKDLNNWIKFFHKDKKSMTKYVSMLKKSDKTFLTKGFPQDIDAENLFPLNGLLENDFLNVLKNQKNINDSYTRLIIAVIYQVNFEDWKKVYKEKLLDVFEKSLIEGEYENFDLDLEKIISIFIKKELIDQKNFMAISLLRGMFLGKKYSSEEQMKNLNKKIKINKWKIKLGF